MRDPVRRTLVVMNALIRGDELDRSTAAELMGVEKPEGYSRLLQIKTLVQGVRTRKPGRSTLFRLSLPKGSASFEMAVAACIASGLSKLLAGSKFEQALRSALDHVLAACDEANAFSHADRKFFFVRQGGEVGLPGNAELLEAIAAAVVHQQYVQLEYQNFAGTVERKTKVKPLSLAIYNHQLYLLCERQDRTRHPYRFSRIVAARRLDTRFEYPSLANYDPETLFRHTFGIYLGADEQVERVRLRLSSRWSAYADAHRWHPSQRVHTRQDGTVELELDVCVCPELEEWILGFGEQAEVIGPARLRRTIRDRVAHLSAIYR